MRTRNSKLRFNWKKLLEDTPPRCSEIQFNFKFWAKLGYRERERE